MATSKRKHLTQDEVAALLQAAKAGSHPERDYCLITLCFLHGFRASELRQLRLSDIDLTGKRICIYRLKKGFSTIHPLLDEEVKALTVWLGMRGDFLNANTEWLFLSRQGNPLSRQRIYQLIAQLGTIAGIGVQAHPHMLRHACGFALADRGVDTRLIQDYLGHRNIRHTVWYTASNAQRFYGVWDDKKTQI
ncbi:site-specific tyrosine recombinase XerC [Yersinia thracica]|uniref:Site-specific tyrosine recombinase XerC n=1 Tax=Yersinia thracica TaxID=2890319 RepID=A0A0T9NGG8_9GAMM|nr:tyrosine-type DNA invertase [Yersinia thracica]CNH07132.1 site-specific tyrosine recombinase XerC [Yersinia thracica]